MIENKSNDSTGHHAHEGDVSIGSISDFTRASPGVFQNNKIPLTSSILKPECRDITEVYKLGE